MNNPTIESVVAERGTIAEEVLLEVVYALDRNTAELERVHDAIRKRDTSRNAEMREIVSALRSIANNV